MHTPAAVVEAIISAPLRMPTTPQPDFMLCCELDPASGSSTTLSRSAHEERATLHMASSSRQAARERATAGSSTSGRAAVEGLASQHISILTDLLHASVDLAPRTALAEVVQPSAGRADGYCVHPGALDSGLQLGQLCLDPRAGSEGASFGHAVTAVCVGSLCCMRG